MRNFNVKVNGKSYNVEVEDLNGSGSQTVPSQVQAVAPTVQVAQAAAPVAAKQTAATGVAVKSPMPGLILKLLVANGATVKKNDKILILEAMKMENDILASADGIVNFSSKQGDTVETGDILASIN